ncbi:MAG: platelet-activating factor acetylhydrolase IB subunit [Planctomycetota bacterium]
MIPVPQDAPWAKKWWMPRHDLKLAQRKSMPQVDLLMIGDSITHSWESAGKQVFDEFYGQRNTLNLGFSGDRTEHVIWRLQSGAVDDINPKLAVLMIGTNNTGHRKENPDHTAEGIRRIVDELKLRLPTTKILVLAVFPRSQQPDNQLRKINNAINENIQTIGNLENVWYLDIGDKFLDEDGTLPKSIMNDFLHPGEKGYRIWAEAMEPTVAELMK